MYMYILCTLTFSFLFLTQRFLAFTMSPLDSINNNLISFSVGIPYDDPSAHFSNLTSCIARLKGEREREG